VGNETRLPPDDLVRQVGSTVHFYTLEVTVTHTGTGQRRTARGRFLALSPVVLTREGQPASVDMFLVVGMN
jgi:hypothetical protein